MLPFLIQTADNEIARQAELVRYNRQMATQPAISSDYGSSRLPQHEICAMKFLLDGAFINQHNNQIKRRKLS